MKILKDIKQNTEEWLDARRGKITGSKLRGIVPLRGNARKIGFYELLADRLAVQEEGEPEDARERGHRLEAEAIEAFQFKMDKEVESVGICISDDNANMALSPDGLIKNDGKYTEAVEIKCVSSALHLQALIEQEIPTDFTAQKLQYFIVNKDLGTLYFIYYDPRVTVKPIHWIEVKRADVEDEIEFYKKYQEDTLEDINKILEDLTF